MNLFLLLLPLLQDNMEAPQENDKDRSQDKIERDLDKGKRRLTDERNAQLAQFALDKQAEGLDPKELEKAIRKKEHELWDEQVKARKEGKEKDDDAEAKKEDKHDKGPGEALHHGLSKKDLTNMGRFVNEKLAEGLRGKDLAEAIHHEHDRLKEARERNREHAERERDHKDRDRDHDHEKDHDHGGKDK